MDANLYGKSNVDKQTLFTRFESETISATKNIGHEKLNPITCSKANIVPLICRYKKNELWNQLPQFCI